MDKFKIGDYFERALIAEEIGSICKITKVNERVLFYDVLIHRSKRGENTRGSFSIGSYIYEKSKILGPDFEINVLLYG